MKWNKFSTHREFFIGFIKFINPVVTLQNAVRYRVELALCSTKLTPNEANKFTITTSNKNENQQKKEVNDTNNGINDELGEYAPIQLPVFDILSKKESYGNGTRRVFTSAFEGLKGILCHLSASDEMVSNNKNINFIAYDRPQYSSSELYRSQIIKRIFFLHNTAITPLMDIDYDNMYSNIIPKLSIILLIKKSIKETHLTHSSGKWLFTTTKKLKNQVQMVIDSIIEQGEFPENNDTSPGWIVKQHNHQDLISYANMLKVDTQTYDEKLIIYFHSANKHPVSISYELLSDEHATVNNKKIRSASHQ